MYVHKDPMLSPKNQGFFCGRTNLINNKFCFRSYNCFKDVARHGEAKAYLFFKMYIINRSKTQEIDLCSVSRRHTDGSATPVEILMGACNQGEKFLDSDCISSQALRLLCSYISKPRSSALSCDLNSFSCLFCCSLSFSCCCLL